MTNYPFAHKSPRAKRPEPRRVSGRVRLDSEEYDELRFKAYQRANGKCECGCGRMASYFLRRPNPDAGEFAHDEHGSRKSDELNRGRWLNWQCHEKSHNAGGKPVPRRPGRVMNRTEANNYWHGQKCFCERWKKSKESFCSECVPKLSPQIRYDLENAVGKEYCQAVAAGELEILAAQRVESAR